MLSRLSFASRLLSFIIFVLHNTITKSSIQQSSFSLVRLGRKAVIKPHHVAEHTSLCCSAWSLEWSSWCVFEVQVGSKLNLHLSTFRTKIVWVWTGPSNSQHLNPSILSPIVYQMVLQGWDLNSSSTTITTPRLLSRGWWRLCLQYPTFHTKMVHV